MKLAGLTLVLRPAGDGGCEIAAYDAKGDLVEAKTLGPLLSCLWIGDLAEGLRRTIPSRAPAEARDAGR